MPSIASELSALRGQWTVTESQFTLLQIGHYYQLCQANPLRWAVLFSFAPVPGNVNAAAYITTLQNQASPFGIILSANNLVEEWSYRQLGGLVQQQLFGTPGTNGMLVQVIEVLAVSGSFFG